MNTTAGDIAYSAFRIFGDEFELTLQKIYFASVPQATYRQYNNWIDWKQAEDERKGKNIHINITLKIQ